MRNPLQRLYETKLAFIATVFTALGIALLAVAHLAERAPGYGWLAQLPVTDLGSALFTTGLVVIVFEYLDGQDSDERATARLRGVLREQAPAMRDAVIDGFAFDASDLARVSSPAVLDQVARNVLAIQLGDEALAHDAYEDLRLQVLEPRERRRNLRVRIDLAPGPVGPTPLYAATIVWEYEAIPGATVQRFACVSDPLEYRELRQEAASPTVWQFIPAGGLDAGSPEAFELTSFTVDGVARPIRRTARAGSQTYTATLGRQVVEAGRPVKVSYTYRTLVRQQGHLLHLELGQPTKGLDIELRWGGTNIREVRVLDFIASAQHPVIATAAALPASSASVAFDGWALPRSGVAFVWMLESELGAPKRASREVAAGPSRRPRSGP